MILKLVLKCTKKITSATKRNIEPLIIFKVVEDRQKNQHFIYMPRAFGYPITYNVRAFPNKVFNLNLVDVLTHRINIIMDTLHFGVTMSKHLVSLTIVLIAK